MNDMSFGPAHDATSISLSRRGFLRGGATALALTTVISPSAVLAQASTSAAAPPQNPFEAVLELRSDGTAFLQIPFIEGGQGSFTTMAQIAGEELDLDPASFSVQCAPPRPEFRIPGTRRVTGGSGSTRTVYMPLRRLGAAARIMLMNAAAARMQVSVSELSTEPGRVVHAATGRSIGYGELADDAVNQPIPQQPPLRETKDFRWIDKPVARIDVHDKSTGRAKYAIDQSVEGMLLAAVQHAPRLGMQPGSIINQTAVEAMAGVHSVHILPGAVAVIADRWWRARRASEALQVNWTEAAAGTANIMPANFSTAEMREEMLKAPGPGFIAENTGNAAAVIASATQTVEASYDVPFVAHAQLEPPSALAIWDDNAGRLELWVPNQAPELFLNAAAKVAGISPENVTLHTPMLGGFFGRHFLYADSNPYPQAILLSKAVNRPVKVIWTREEEFLRDSFRPAAAVRFKAGLDPSGMPIAINIEAISDGLMTRMQGAPAEGPDRTVVEGLSERVYKFENRHVTHIRYSYPPMIGAFRSVGHSFNDFFMECFTDEIADKGGIDPLELRRRLVAHSPRHLNLLDAVVDLAGGWKRGPFTAADGSRRARGLAMASPFGTETATIAEVSIREGRAHVHDIWVAIDPGNVVNPQIVVAQVQGASALGLSTTLLEQVVYDKGMPQARNYDGYPILPPSSMPQVHVRIVESGATMGGIGEPGLPGVPPSVVNAVAVLTGQRVRSLPMSQATLGEA